jgi:hypothetical protein
MMGVLAALHGLGPEIRTDAAFEAGVRALLDQLGWSAVRVDEALVGVTRPLDAPVTPAEKVMHTLGHPGERGDR